jgi:Zn-dependent protease with chaperone function
MGHGLKRLFMSHPPLEERIAALKSVELTGVRQEA